MSRWNKLTRRVREQGLIATAVHLGRRLLWQSRRLDPRFRRRLQEHLTFDEVHGVSTSGDVLLADLDLPDAARSTSYWYEPANPWKVREAILAARPRFEDTTFVDLGSGKGRMLFIAAAHPFRELIGVELSETLHREARRNLERFVARTPDAPRILLLCGDARTFEFPPGNLFVALYNPFNAEVLASVLGQLDRAMKSESRTVHLAYINPVHHDVIDGSGLFREVKRHRAYRVYRNGLAK